MIAGQILLQKGLLDERQLLLAREALAADGRLDRAAIGLGFVSEEDALQAVAEALGLETVDLAHTQIDLELLKTFPVKLIHQYQIFPIRWESDSLLVATGDPFDLHALDAVSAATSWSVVPLLAPSGELAKLIKTHLGVGAETVDGLLAQREDANGVEVLEEL